MLTGIFSWIARIAYKIVKVLLRIVFWLMVVLGLLSFAVFVILVCYLASDNTDPHTAETIRSAASQGKFAYKLTEPNELKALLGQPTTEIITNDGGMQILFLGYPGVIAKFGKMKDFSSTFTLIYLKTGGRCFSVGNFYDSIGGVPVDIGWGKPITLRNEVDLTKFDTFWGLADVSLENVDLKGQMKVLETMPFDSRTVWPEPNKLPEGFEPARLLEEGKNPGLGIRNLHKQGIDGNGVGIAIIDQPLLRNHREYAERLVKYQTIGLMSRMSPPQMHGPPVCSIAVGKTCGVAPAASLFYYSVTTWLNNCRPFCDAINKILELNKTLKASEKIRVVSISTGMFSAWENFDDWKKTVEKAAGEGILIVTCDPAFLEYGTLARISNKDPDDPSSYKRGRYSPRNPVLLVPTGNRTIASYCGPEVYTFDRVGGMSWGAPYLAGLAALAFQVDPDIKPETIVDLWLQTAVKTDAGPVVNPTVFIEAVKKLSSKTDFKK
jgi:hypothetical protein